MVLDLSDESVAVKRALGRRVDPLTGRAYHLEFDPPPAKEPGLADRLKVKCSARQWVDRLRVVAQPLWARSAGTPQCSSGQSPAARVSRFGAVWEIADGATCMMPNQRC